MKFCLLLSSVPPHSLPDFLMLLRTSLWASPYPTWDLAFSALVLLRFTAALFFFLSYMLILGIGCNSFHLWYFLVPSNSWYVILDVSFIGCNVLITLFSFSCVSCCFFSMLNLTPRASLNSVLVLWSYWRIMLYRALLSAVSVQFFFSFNISLAIIKS